MGCLEEAYIVVDIHFRVDMMIEALKALVDLLWCFIDPQAYSIRAKSVAERHVTVVEKL